MAIGGSNVVLNLNELFSDISQSIGGNGGSISLTNTGTS